jgi:predicted transglutaminase-like cysteine proteinase
MASAGTLRPSLALAALALAVSALDLLAASQPAKALGFGQELAALRQADQLRQLAGAELRGPAGWTAWCAADPAGCMRTDAAIVALDATTAATIQRIFALVHDRITPEVEPPGADVWRVVEEPGPGDCEDYALTWRRELVKAGLPRAALDIAVVMTEQHEIHAVLVIQTDHGSLVLDNRHDRPLAWSSLPYAWLALEPTRPEAAGWQALPDYDVIGATPTVTAEGRR